MDLLKRKLEHWNNVAAQHGALEHPYSREVEDLNRMIDWYKERIFAGSAIVVPQISIGSLGYLKAALTYAAWVHESEDDKIVKTDWPSAVQDAVSKRAQPFRRLADEIKAPAASILDELRPDFGVQMNSATEGEGWDAFISHAHEDKAAFVAPLATELSDRGLRVWYDDFALSVGDRLRRSIDRGLARSRFGIVVLSPRFFEKEWPMAELDGLAAREADGRKIILPIWHGIDREGVCRYSPLLADRIAARSVLGGSAVADELLRAMGKPVVTSVTASKVLGMSNEARTLLLDLARPPSRGVLQHVRRSAGTVVRISQHDYITDDGPRTMAKWCAAVDELLRLGFVEHRGGDRVNHHITKAGFDAADLMR